MRAKTGKAIAAPAAKAGSKATGASGGCRASSGASSALRSARSGAVYLSPLRRVTVIVLPGDHHFPCALLFGVEQRARPSVNVAGCAEVGREQGTGNRGILGAGALRGEALRLVPAAAGTAQGDPSRASGRTEGKSSV